MRYFEIFFFLALGFPLKGTVATPDFWEKTPQFAREFYQEKKIFVSAKNVNGQTLSLGAGMVDAPLERVWDFANDPERIKKTTPLLEDLRWNKDTGELDLYLKVVGYRYHIRGIATAFPDPHHPQISLKVVENAWVPFTAVLELRSPVAQKNSSPSHPFPPGQTLVRISGESSKDRSLSWPLRVGLEAVLHKVAGTLREAVEKDSQPLKVEGK